MDVENDAFDAVVAGCGIAGLSAATAARSEAFMPSARATGRCWNSSAGSSILAVAGERPSAAHGVSHLLRFKQCRNMCKENAGSGSDRMPNAATTPEPVK